MAIQTYMGGLRHVVLVFYCKPSTRPIPDIKFKSITPSSLSLPRHVRVEVGAVQRRTRRCHGEQFRDQDHIQRNSQGAADPARGADAGCAAEVDQPLFVAAPTAPDGPLH